MSDVETEVNLVEMAAEIVAAYVRNNSVPASDLPQLLQSIHTSLNGIVSASTPEAVVESAQPKVPIKKSVTDEFIVCLEDGKRFKSLKRHLQSEHGLSPQEYRAKWGLPKDYPMVAQAYANARSSLAKTLGLGRKSAAPAVEPVAALAPDGPAADTSAKKPRRQAAAATA